MHVGSVILSDYLSCRRLQRIHELCLGPALGGERPKPLHGDRVEDASRQPFGAGGLLLPILKLGHDAPRQFQGQFETNTIVPEMLQSG